MGNKARPSLATPGTMSFKNCYQAGFPYFRNRGTPVSVENAHTCLSAELNSSLSSPLQSARGQGVPSSVVCCFLPQGYSVFQKQNTVTLLLFNFHFPRPSKDRRQGCAVSKPQVWNFFFHLIYAVAS